MPTPESRIIKQFLEEQADKGRPNHILGEVPRINITITPTPFRSPISLAGLKEELTLRAGFDRELHVAEFIPAMLRAVGRGILKQTELPQLCEIIEAAPNYALKKGNINCVQQLKIIEGVSADDLARLVAQASDPAAEIAALTKYCDHLERLAFGDNRKDSPRSRNK